MASAQDVLAEVLAQPQQVAHRLLVRWRHAYRGELAGAEQPTELARVAAVGLDTLTGLARDEGGRDDGAGDTERTEQTLQLVPAGPRLIADAYVVGLAPTSDETTNLFGTIGDLLLVRDRVAGSQQRHADGVLVHVESDVRERDTGEHGRCPPFVAPLAPVWSGRCTDLGRRRAPRGCMAGFVGALS